MCLDIVAKDKASSCATTRSFVLWPKKNLLLVAQEEASSCGGTECPPLRKRWRGDARTIKRTNTDKARLEPGPRNKKQIKGFTVLVVGQGCQDDINGGNHPALR